MDLEQLGYFIYMDECEKAQQKKQQTQQEQEEQEEEQTAEDRIEICFGGTVSHANTE